MKNWLVTLAIFLGLCGSARLAEAKTNVWYSQVISENGEPFGLEITGDPGRSLKDASLTVATSDCRVVAAGLPPREIKDTGEVLHLYWDFGPGRVMVSFSKLWFSHANLRLLQSRIVGAAVIPDKEISTTRTCYGWIGASMPCASDLEGFWRWSSPDGIYGYRIEADTAGDYTVTISLLHDHHSITCNETREGVNALGRSVVVSKCSMGLGRGGPRTFLAVFDDSRRLVHVEMY